MSNKFLESAKKRRSIYALNKAVSLSNSQIQAVVETAIQEAPAAFGAQSTRVVVLFDSGHNQLWDVTESALRKVVPENNWQPTGDKLNSFRQGYGTILFFEDQAVIHGLQERFALYANNFPKWGMQAQGIALYTVWAALASENIGASIQHYNELIEQEVKAKWALPEGWMLKGQMPFGGIAAPAADKPAMNVAEFVKVIH